MISHSLYYVSTLKIGLYIKLFFLQKLVIVKLLLSGLAVRQINYMTSSKTAKYRSLLAQIVIVSISLLLTSCALLKANETLEPSQFLKNVGIDTQENKAKHLGQPWKHAWELQSDYGKYESIHLKPVNLGYINQEVRNKFLKASTLSAESYDKRVAKLADYFNQSLRESLAHFDGERKLALVDSPQGHTLIIEIALTEIVFNEPSAYLTSLAVPIPGSSLMVESVTTPYLSFEVIITDSVENEVIATIADRAFPTYRAIDLDKLTVDEGLKKIIDVWVKELVESSNQVITEKLPPREFFRLF